MSEVPPDLPRLRTVVTYLRGELGRAERALNTAEEREALAARCRPPAEPPARLIERGIGAGRLPVRVHAGGLLGQPKTLHGHQHRPGACRGDTRLPALPPRHRPRDAGVNGQRHGGGMPPALRVVVYPPDAEGGRRVRVDGEILGRALGPGDLLEFLRRAGLDPDDVHLDDPLPIEWRGGGPAVWSPDTGEE